MAALPLVLDKLVGTSLAVILSITLLLIFGEILPQALCNKYGLQVAAALNWLLWVFVYCTFAGSFLFARILEKVVGSEELQYYKRREIEQIIEQQAESSSENDSENDDANLNQDEINQIKAVIRSAKLNVGGIMTEIGGVYMLDINTVFNQETIAQISKHNHSRILISENGEIIGILHVKSLILHDPEGENLTLNREKIKKNLIFFDSQMRVFEALNQFQTGKGHLALVKNQADDVIGIVTLEDVIEAILCEEIYDEGDQEEMDQAVN